MTVSRSSRPEMPRARAEETASSAIVNTRGDIPGTPWAKAVVTEEVTGLGAGAGTTSGSGAVTASTAWVTTWVVTGSGTLAATGTGTEAALAEGRSAILAN